MSLINRCLFLLILYIMYGCTYTVEESSPMNFEALQQRSRSGKLTPGSNQKINFQLPYFLDLYTGEPEPGTHTVQFNISDPNDPASNYIVRARAEIIWNVGGNSVRRVVDCVDGMSVTGVAEGAIINVSDNSEIIAPPNPNPYDVAILVTKGSRASVEQPPTYSFDQELLAAAPDNTVTFEIPDDIGAISAMVTVSPQTIGSAIGAYEVLVIQGNAAGTNLKQYDPRQSDFVPLMPGCRTITVNALNTIFGTTNLYVQLTLGIDG